ncbi:Type 1 glutamine amidotransferase-like domain-containing protein [Nocardioides sp. CFH 31398]|uniref:Type 1 glutamine amidotransferase-like domain-containing protein n=1 Tax=Nocardioides sp. CFH 31398 TaxID=2919579 RepID=UPI001F054EC8|nr:Type 1 glutamine amidotransferase-like domain-containing protein [Nocardioides sp. CFH 31398]MCH1868533.1 Type 1 glutamine amidotransferase-like domain-containing protein [Nocardioides sp. CFH 31398]
MKLLLTSGGVSNPSIREALVGLLGRPVEESTALVVPTASWGHPMTGPGNAWRFVAGRSGLPMAELGWRSVGLLELTALPSIGRERWEPWVTEADVLLVGGGDALYLHHWLHESGLAAVLPSLDETVWVGLSAGSMVMTPRVGADFVEWEAPSGTDETLGVVDFSIFPHLDSPDLPENTAEEAARWAAELGGPAYALDDASAIRVVGGEVDVVSEGSWRRFG